MINYGTQTSRVIAGYPRDSETWIIFRNTGENEGRERSLISREKKKLIKSKKTKRGLERGARLTSPRHSLFFKMLEQRPHSDDEQTAYLQRGK